MPNRRKLTEIVDRLYKTRILTNDGPYLRTLEQRLAQRLQVEYAVVVSSATIALQLVVRALGLSGECILPSFTFVATAQALVWEGITPIFVDIEPEHFSLDPTAIEAVITSRTSAVMAVNLFSNPCAIEEISEVCKCKNLKLIFDSAQALGSYYKGTPLGSFGDAEVFSLHATKIINTLEGGVITTNDSHLYRELVLMRNFGFTGFDRVEALGINAKLNELSAAIGLAALDDLDENIEKNKIVHSFYDDLLGDLPGIKTMDPRPNCLINFHTFPIIVGDEFGVNRDQLNDVLLKENVIARRYYYPGCHRMQPFKSQIPDDRAHLPVTEGIADSILCLPCFPDMEKESIEQIVDLLYRIYEQRSEIATHFQEHEIDQRLLD